MSTPDDALERLLEGNKRFVSGASVHPNRCEETRKNLESAQKPYAVILSCSDSRVPVEIIFDVGFGEVFVVRTAGHTLSQDVMGSIEYAVQELGVQLVMILGHNNCGAVKSAVKTYSDEDSRGAGNVQAILDHIYPAVKKTCSCCDAGSKDFIDKAVKENVRYQVSELIKKDRYIAALLKFNQIKVVGAYYDIAASTIELLD